MTSKTKPLLLLLTAGFPFGKGEEFLETEILYLVQKFRVEIIPVASIEQEKQRPLPDGTVAHPIRNYSNRVHLTCWLLRSPRSVLKIFRLFIAETKNSKTTFKGYAELFFFALRAEYLYQTLQRLYNKKNVAVIYSYWLSKGALTASLWKQDNQDSTVFSRAHRFDLYHFRSADRLQPYQKLMVSTLDRIFPCSKHGENYLKRLYTEHAAKIQTLRLGVRPAPAKNHSPLGNTLHIVSCAYLSRVKRVNLLVEALRKYRSSIHWTHLGGGELQPEIEQLASSLPDNISWEITGPLANHEVLEFYKSKPVDLFVNTSESEGLPVSIMEAMSFGIPAAATDVGGTRELVIDGYNGYLWPHDVTSAAISITMDTFFNFPLIARKSIREAAWQTWNEKVNAETQYTEFAHTVLEMIENENR